MDSKSGFEIMAENDCFFLGSTYGKEVMTHMQLGLNVVGPLAYLISFVVGFLILSKEEYNKYPFKIVGLICLVQSAAIFSLDFIYFSNCDTFY